MSVVPTMRLWHFGDAVLDGRTLELSVAGRPVELERKHLEILVYLLQNAGVVVLKQQLAAAVWPGKPVTDSNLTKCIAMLRHALGDAQQTIIKTVHGFGYRLAAQVWTEEALPMSFGSMLAPAETRP